MQESALRQRQRKREESEIEEKENSKTSFFKDCSLGLVKTVSAKLLISSVQFKKL